MKLPLPSASWKQSPRNLGAWPTACGGGAAAGGGGGGEGGSTRKRRQLFIWHRDLERGGGESE